nr:MAG TPA: hypothetical protein [Caudoviricetes sp.]
MGNSHTGAISLSFVQRQEFRTFAPRELLTQTFMEQLNSN